MYELYAPTPKVSAPLPAAMPWLVLALWAASIFTLARNGVFVEPPGALPLRLLAAVAVPIVLFLAARAFIPAVRAWVDTLDLGFVVAAQTGRVIGAVFLIQWAMGDLPLFFAMPAGLGDIAVGVLAVFVTLDVARQSPGWKGRVRWLVALGLLDFASVFGAAILVGPGHLLFIAGAPTPEMMQVLPMALIPTFGVPLFMIFHLIALIRLRNAG